MKDAVVLLSGGLDSATTLAIARLEGYRVHALTVAYGQRHAIEVDRAREVARDLGATSHRVLRLDLSFLHGSSLTDRRVPVPKGRDDGAIGEGIPSTYVPARNTVFLSLALAWAETLGATDVYLGVNALDYSGYPDCRPEYLAAFEAMAQLATRAGVEGRRLTIHVPLLHSTKADIVRRARDLGVDLARTISCYDPGEDACPCGACDACRLRARGFAEAGMDDPALRGGDV